eukprot:TRINITY_DN13942_c0_g1_i1.p1 TRINITY_DN13942_c0_g1~~TRINITY_DN13942_c0_g1_i1.p1  ORF type:complete len:489 (-),score=93.45 TRINITY_DN13942_c0_g1_i1:195-1661(-)
MKRISLGKNFSVKDALQRCTEQPREVLDEIGKKLNVSKWTDWYQITAIQIARLDDETLGLIKTLAKSQGINMNGRMFHPQLLEKVYSDYEWRVWHFSAVPKDFWLDERNQRAFMRDLAVQYNITKMEDWYRISAEDIAKHGGESLLRIHKSKLNVYRYVFPHYKWDSDRFNVKGESAGSFWAVRDNQITFIENLAKTLGIKKWEDWYQVEAEMFTKHGGISLLARYNASFVKALMAIYPQHPWKPWLFLRAPRKTWEDKEIMRQFFDYVSKQLQIKEFADWYSVKFLDVVRLGGRGPLFRYGDTLFKALCDVYPEFTWEKENFKPASKTSKSQNRLFNILTQQFPKLDVHVNMKMKEWNENVANEFAELEIDIAVPSVGLAVEYQGQQHFHEKEHFFDSNKKTKINDERKREAFKQLGADVIEIPYWWDGRPESALATFHLHRPDLFAAVPGILPVPLTKPHIPFQKRFRHKRQLQQDLIDKHKPKSN